MSSAVEESIQALSVRARSAMLSRAARVCWTSVSVKMPTPCKAFAHARSTAISYGRSRRSNRKERWNASKRASGAFSKRPPQRRSDLRSGLTKFLSQKNSAANVPGDIRRLASNFSERSGLAAFGFGFRSNRHRKRKQVDEAFGVLWVVAAHGKAGQIGSIERVRRETL